VRRVPIPALKPLSVRLTEPPVVPALYIYIVTGMREPGSPETGSVYRLPVDVGADPPDRAQI
jgi:hypothetical protein